MVLADLDGLRDRWAWLALLTTSSVREHHCLAYIVHGADACPVTTLLPVSALAYKYILMHVPRFNLFRSTSRKNS
jgi:hypothetical protein